MAYILTKEALVDLLDTYGLTIENFNLLPSERSIRRLFWRDDMENYTQNKWAGYTPGSVVAYVNNEIAAFEGDYVLRLSNPGDTSIWVNADFGRFDPGRHSVEVRWWMNANIDTLNVSPRLGDPDNSRFLRAWIAYSPALLRWRYYDQNGVWQDIPGGAEEIGNNTWNYIKIVTDWLNGNHYRLVTNGLDLDMSSLPLYPNPTLPINQRRFTFWLAGRMDVANQPLYFDDARIYLNEV